MSKIAILGKILLLVLFFIGLFFLSRQAQEIRSYISNQLGLARGQVAGARTSMEQEMKKDVSSYLSDAKEKAMDVKVSDLIEPIMRFRKIGEDAKNLQTTIEEEISKWTKK